MAQGQHPSPASTSSTCIRVSVPLFISKSVPEVRIFTAAADNTASLFPPEQLGAPPLYIHTRAGTRHFTESISQSLNPAHFTISDAGVFHLEPVLKNRLLLAPVGAPVIVRRFLGKGLQSARREAVFLYRSALQQLICPVHTPFEQWPDDSPPECIYRCICV